MIALAFLAIAAGCALLALAATKMAGLADDYEQARHHAAVEVEYGSPVPDWDWPPPSSITNRKVHNGTEDRPR